MKKIAIISLSLIFFTACKKQNNEMHSNAGVQPNLFLKNNAQKSKLTRPMKVKFNSSVDPASPNLTCTMPGVPFGIANSGYFLQGNATHLGNINSATSMGLDGFCNLSPALILTTKTSGQIVSANGDKITYTGDDLIDLNNVVLNGGTTAAITGLWTITGGTGKFSGAYGSFTINGVVNVATAGGPTFSISGEGTITY